MKKYIKVLTADRLPEETELYDTDLGCIDFHVKDGNFWDNDDRFKMYPKWWLEEVEDNDIALTELLEEGIEYLYNCEWPKGKVETFGNYIMNAKAFINELKNASPSDASTNQL